MGECRAVVPTTRREFNDRKLQIIWISLGEEI